MSRQAAAAVVMDTTDMTADAAAIHARFPHIAWHRAADLITASLPGSARIPETEQWTAPLRLAGFADPDPERRFIAGCAINSAPTTAAAALPTPARG